MLQKTQGMLYCGGHNMPVAEIKLNKELKQLNNKIVECKYDLETGQWIFMRERTDKSFPNAIKTAEGKQRIFFAFWSQNNCLTFSCFLKAYENPSPPKDCSNSSKNIGSETTTTRR